MARSIAFYRDPLQLAGDEAGKIGLAKHQGEIDREAKSIYGGRSGVVRDPDGRRIECKTAAVVQAPARPAMPIAQKPDQRISARAARARRRASSSYFSRWGMTSDCSKDFFAASDWPSARRA